MKKQRRLFHENRLESDYFISGNPNFPDPDDPDEDRYIYWNEQENIPVAEAIAEVLPFPHLRLCTPVEDGWQLAEVIELHPKGVA